MNECNWISQPTTIEQQQRLGDRCRHDRAPMNDESVIRTRRRRVNNVSNDNDDNTTCDDDVDKYPTTTTLTPTTLQSTTDKRKRRSAATHSSTKFIHNHTSMHASMMSMVLSMIIVVVIVTTTSSSSSIVGVHGLSLLGGRYQTVTDVSDYLNLALDAAAMKETTVIATKKDIYRNGSPRSDGSTNTVTLQSLSTTAESYMVENPYYHIFRHAFLVLGNANEHETSGMFDGAPIEVYGDTLVNDLFDLSAPNIETEAAVVMNVWMACVNYVWEVLTECRAQNKETAMLALDRAVALWIGEGQVDGSNDRGHLLYHIAENAGERFDQDTGETAVNTKAIGLFVEMQTMLLGDQCSTVQGYELMRENVKRLVGVMTIPLVQNLIHHTMNVGNEGGSDFVELYALSLIPRVAACDPEAYDTELHLDVLRTLPVSKQQESIDAIQRAYTCLEVTCSDVGSYLGGAVPECVDGGSITRAGYTSGQLGRSRSYVDRDILQIDIFTKFQAYGIALDWYTHGWNSLYPLRDLARNEVVPPLQASSGPSQYSVFSEFYQDEIFAHTMIENAIELIPPYNSASREQVRNTVTGLLKYVVMRVSAVDHLKYAVDECRNGNRDASIEFVDAAAMFFIGSMEGSAEGGNSFGGELLFTTAKEVCSDFGTCVAKSGATSAAVNDVVVSSLMGVKSSVDLQNCDEASDAVENTIVPTMSVPLIQGTLKYASINKNLEAGTTDASLSIGDTFALGIIPLVNQVSTQGADSIRSQMQFQLNTNPVSGGFAVVADAFRSAVSGMRVDCSQVGELADEPGVSNLCSDGTPTDSVADGPVAPDTPAGLAFGRYTFSDNNVADDDGSFALDVKAMFMAESNEEAKTIYVNGQNALDGLFGSEVTTLAEMSTKATASMKDDLMFNIFKYALYTDDQIETFGDGEFQFANDVVLEALAAGNDKKLAAEAAVILNVWMLISHRLSMAVRSCDKGETPTALIDSAVALWIGKEQVEGKYADGWMLYSIGQSSMKLYGFPEAEAPVNTKLMSLFVEAQSVARSCAESSSAPKVLRTFVYDILQTLTNPLIKSMLFHMAKNSKNMVELYAVAVVPQCASCNPRAQSELQNALFSGYDRDTVLTDDLYDNLGKFLRCQRVTCQDIRTDVDADDMLKDLVENLCERLEYDLDYPLPMAGYTPQTSVVETQRLDLDALEMFVMMRTKAYTMAMDIYENGHNSVGASSFFGTDPGATDQLTLKQLATTSEREIVPQYQAYRDLLGSDDYADVAMTQAIQRTDDYASASREEAALVVGRISQALISYMGVLMKLQSAINKCKSGSADNARADWDRAVALYVGFAQGIHAGGQNVDQGEWMYALANEVCSDFGVCESSGEATVNRQLLLQFAGGRDSLIDGACDHIKEAVDSEIIPRLIIPLVQGTIKFAIDSNSGNRGSLVSLHVVSAAVAPFLGDSDAALLIQSYGKFQSISTTTPVSSVVSAFVETIDGTGISCNEIGSPSGYTLCSRGPSDNIPLEETPTSLAEDLYVTTTYVQDRADIAQDINDMNEALLERNYELAKIVYRDGKNSQIFDKDGMFVGLRTLKGFSTDSTLEMLDEPEFNIFMYALNGNRAYGNDLVEEALQNADSTNPEIPTEAAMVLNLWMEIVHRLHETLQACKVKELRDEDGVHSMDIAVAYWIGDGQIAGDADNGHLLYALTEKFGELFNIDDGGQSKTNTNILRLFNEAKNEVSLPNACSDSRTTFTRLRRIVNQLVSQMSIPLVQGLIHYLRTNDRDRVKIYATAYVPLVAGCSPSLFHTLQDKLLFMNYNVIEVEDIIVTLRKSFPCLGLQCDDIGVHVSEETDENTACDDPDVYEPLAGYRPATDVREEARLDLDIRELDVLMQMKAYDAALELYTYGKHVKGPNRGSRSLSQIATTSQRSVVPEYDAFVRYYSNDGYADQLVRSAMDTSLTSFTDDQRRSVVIKACQVLVMYFGALQNAYNAYSECTSSAQLRTIGNTETWDKVAAELIGHLEGSKENGTVEGYMFYDLAQEHCLEFGTCNADGSGVEVNDKLISLLYTGRGAVIDKSCQAIRKAADELSSLLLVPIIQGALSSAIGLSSGEDDQLRAEGYVYSRALVPLVRKRRAANSLEDYLGSSPPSHVRHTASEVYGALATAYPDMGVDCEMIGYAAGNDPCSGVVYVSDTVWIVVGVVGGLLIIGCCCFFWRRRRRTINLPENNPKFVTSDGELNHSMDLLEKAFASTSPRGAHSPAPTERSHTGKDSETEALNAFHDASPADDDEDFESIPSLSARLKSTGDII